MPESVSGTFWSQHRVTECPNCKALNSFKKRKCKGCGWERGTRSIEPSRLGGQQPGNTTQRDHDGAYAFKQDVDYVDCPGCPKCLPNDGLVLRRGSWRPTESYETILMLTKSPGYFADQEAVREKANPDTQRSKPVDSGIADGNVFNGDRRQNYEKERHRVSSRNLRDVWQFPTQAYGGAHFATFPERLPEICIKASTSEWGVCPVCGAPWARVIKRESHYSQREEAHAPNNCPTKVDSTGWEEPTSQTLGWRPTCKCGREDVVPATVLDPFCGTGTTLFVAKKLGRRSIGYDISEEYCQMALERTRQGVLF